ncbi:MAG: hypothetical protein R3E31_01235 [Chloroflexota bacterium]
MACVQCATPLAAGAAYCPECGRFVDDRIEAAIAQYFALNNSNPSGQHKWGSNLKSWFPGLLAASGRPAQPRSR